MHLLRLCQAERWWAPFGQMRPAQDNQRQPEQRFTLDQSSTKEWRVCFWGHWPPFPVACLRLSLLLLSGRPLSQTCLWESSYPSICIRSRLQDRMVQGAGVNTPCWDQQHGLSVKRRAKQRLYDSDRLQCSPRAFRGLSMMQLLRKLHVTFVNRPLLP